MQIILIIVIIIIVVIIAAIIAASKKKLFRNPCDEKCNTIPDFREDFVLFDPKATRFSDEPGSWRDCKTWQEVLDKHSHEYNKEPVIFEMSGGPLRETLNELGKINKETDRKYGRIIPASNTRAGSISLTSSYCAAHSKPALYYFRKEFTRGEGLHYIDVINAAGMILDNKGKAIVICSGPSSTAAESYIIRPSPELIKGIWLETISTDVRYRVLKTLIPVLKSGQINGEFEIIRTNGESATLLSRYTFKPPPQHVLDELERQMNFLKEKINNNYGAKSILKVNNYGTKSILKVNNKGRKNIKRVKFVLPKND